MVVVQRKLMVGCADLRGLVSSEGITDLNNGADSGGNVSEAPTNAE